VVELDSLEDIEIVEEPAEAAHPPPTPPPPAMPEPEPEPEPEPQTGADAPSAEGTPAPAPEAEPVGPAPQAASGGEDAGEFNVFASKSRKPELVELLMETQGIDQGEAEDLAQKPIIPIAKGVSKAQAEALKERFQAARISTRISKKK
jgi:ribosomal protein L7/L12